MHEENTAPASTGTETTSPTQAHPHHYTRILFRHEPHQHQPRDVNKVQKAEQQGFNTHLAVWLTRNVGTMACAYLFAVIGIAGLIGAFTNNTSLVLIFGSISSYFLQLVLLPVILVGGNVLNRHQELQSEETFQTSQHSFHDIEQIMEHLSAQDAELLKQSHMIIHLLKASGISLEQLTAIQGNGDVATTEVQTQG
ncbi:MAG TPA: hypothetical protein VFQ36_25210 [Ktedonobacteraceae bacterium]|nr:hypothetical protein [Ktedonobacteraceae bacterium]